jgi:hypothetical protein
MELCKSAGLASLVSPCGDADEMRGFFATLGMTSKRQQQMQKQIPFGDDKEELPQQRQRQLQQRRSSSSDPGMA